MDLITSIKHNMMTGTYTVHKELHVPILTKKLTPKEYLLKQQLLRNMMGVMLLI